MSKGFASASAQQANRPKTLGDRPESAPQRLFCLLQDPRVERTRLHQLSDILTIAILAVEAMAGKIWKSTVSKQAWLSSFLALMAFPVRIRFRECSSG